MTESQKLKLNSTTADLSLADFFKRNGFVKVPNALEKSSAQTIYEHIKNQQECNLVFDLDGKHQIYNSQDVAWLESTAETTA